MDRMLNKRIEKQSIYDIYRACRLCGAGAGYKMPIIQNVIDLDDQDVQLKQKIRECVQIEVHQDDKMPPLICELCVDKVNDFYEFLDMCRQTNIRTRLRLGLPPQSLPRGAPDAGDCILGLTEPVYINSDEDEPLVKPKRPTSQKNKIKKEPELRIKVEKYSSKVEPRTTRLKARREATPPRVTRLSATARDPEDIALSRLRDTTKSSKISKASPKSILKKEEKSKTEDSLLTPRSKRPRDSRDHKVDTPNKKVKIAIQRSSSPRSKASPASSPRGKSSPAPPPPAPRPRPSSQRPASPPPAFPCLICHLTLKAPQGYASHMKSHTAGFTSLRLACNACGEWFVSGEEAAAHHRRHRSGLAYTCRRCTADFKHQTAYDEHYDKNQCIPFEVVPDVKCEECWAEFATTPLLAAHRCPGRDARPGKCGKCNKSYAGLKNLRRHEATCTGKKKGELIVDPELLARLKPIQVRVARCDPLLTNIKQEHFDVSAVDSNFGLDRSCVYPYISSVSSLRIKSEPEDYDSMVTIKQEIKEEFCTEEDFVHWDSASDSDSEPEVTSVVLNPFAKRKRIDSLSTLSLKTIFSQRFLGKVPKKRRKVKLEHGFDSLLANNDIDDSVRRNIDSIIDNLGNDTNDSPDVFDDLSKDVNNDNRNVVDNDLTDCSNDSAVVNDVTKGGNARSTDNNDLSVVSNDKIAISDGLTRFENTKNDTGTSKDSNQPMDESNDISNTATSKDSNQPMDESNDLITDVNNDSGRNDVFNIDVSENSNQPMDESNDLLIKNDENKVDHSTNDSPTVLQSSFSNEQFNSSLKDVLAEMAGSSKKNDVLNDNEDESNDKSTGNFNDNGKVAVDNDLDGMNDTKDVSTVNDVLENVINNDDIHDSNSFKDNDVSTEHIDSNHVKNVSKNAGSTENDDVYETEKDILNNSNSNINTHNNIDQTNISQNSQGSDHKNNDINDKTDVINDSIISTVNNENNDTYSHENDRTDVKNDNSLNDNTKSQLNSRENDNTTRNEPLNSNFNTDLEYNNDDTSSELKSLNHNDLNETKSTEEDDRRLMEELDAQIAENGGNNDGNDKCDVSDKRDESDKCDGSDIRDESDRCDGSDRHDERDRRDGSDRRDGNDKRDAVNDKITLEDLIAGKDDENSLGLDSISDDDFNFDN